MPRLDSAHPPLWRSQTSLQFGADAVAVIEDPTPWQQRLIAQLERGIPDAAVGAVAASLGAPERGAGELIHRISAALAAPRDTTARVVMQLPDDFPPEHGAAVDDAFAAAGVSVNRSTWFGAPQETVPRGAPVIVVAHHLVEPRRAAAFMSADVPHLPLVLAGSVAEVGPLVIPGTTPCLACIAAARRDADAAWPLVAAQLLGREAPPLRRALTMEAVFVAVRLISAGRPAGSPASHSVRLDENSLERPLRVHHPHAECRCRSLEGNETAADPALLPTTRASAIAQPA